MTHRLRIAFPIISSRAWLGGFNYQLNLVRSLATHVADRIEAVVYFGHDASDDDVAAFTAIAGVEVVRNNAFSLVGQTTRLMRAMLLGLDSDAAAAFASQSIDIVFESARFYGRRLPQATIAWFPDFQHRRLPHLFSRATWWRRDFGFRTQLRYGRTLLLSSEDARHDCESYYPQSRGRAWVLRFPAMIDSNDLTADPETVRARYGIQERFIFVPNQFWRHKNHAVVIEALGILRQRGITACVVSTGSTIDPRDPGLFNGLRAKLDSLGASVLFHTLGVIPRAHVIALMRSCAAFLNPSLCEGWSSGVEEAKHFGVPMLLSDLAVHREQAGQNAEYFSPNDAVALAKLIEDAMTSNSSVAVPRKPVTDSDISAKTYAEGFAKIANHAWEAWRK